MTNRNGKAVTIFPINLCLDFNLIEIGMLTAIYEKTIKLWKRVRISIELPLNKRLLPKNIINIDKGLKSKL